MLIIFSGLSGVGKSTIAKKLASTIKATYLRVDTIEQSLRRQFPQKKIGPEGYLILYELARENLQQGSTVITDSVNEFRFIRDDYRNIAQSLALPFLEIEVICSDQKKHRLQAENRIPDIEGLTPPSWQAINNRSYETWDRAPLQLDTAFLSVEQSLTQILQEIAIIQYP
ncbi:AAA family ATPase [Ignatzschineria rhizosphaerae]|uniref:AAA family ATPase n=1 Tax=Ignatzschineria rhizosphaerae TaxID=2923279 RepID=A0ABY3WYX5_9GAMM|nr:AAA family ATPase [Ignatzschineria rhizosphaerae]UNM95818.1 AAA family ATPase [Ignatzschineria rhizosphaerae]